MAVRLTAHLHEGVQVGHGLVEISDLSVSFLMYDGSLERSSLQVISNLSLTVHPGEILAVPAERYFMLSARMMPMAGCSGGRP